MVAVSHDNEVDLKLRGLAQRTQIRRVRRDDFIAVCCQQNDGRIDHI